MNANSAPALSFEDARAALRWWTEAGVDFALDEAPHNRFTEAQVARAAPAPIILPASPRAAITLPTPAMVAAPDISAQSARAIAAAAHNLDDLKAALDAFEGCGLKKTATQLVFADGAPGAKIMLVGEGPGADEDRIGRPFVGRAGQLLDRMLAAIELDRTKVYIANIVPWRPPGNRAPTPQETTVCLPFIRRQIALCAPKMLVCLGGPSMQTLLGLKDGPMRARGRWYEYIGEDGDKIPALAMLHPAFLLRSPGQKRMAWQDLRKLAKALKNA